MTPALRGSLARYDRKGGHAMVRARADSVINTVESKVLGKAIVEEQKEEYDRLKYIAYKPSTLRVRKDVP